MTLANAKSVNRQTLENVVRNAASEFTRRTAIASVASLRWSVLALLAERPSIRNALSTAGIP